MGIANAITANVYLLRELVYNNCCFHSM